MSDYKTLPGLPGHEDQTMDWYCVAQDVTKEWLSVLLLTLATGILAYVILDNFRPLKYATVATMVVNNINEDENANFASGKEVYENLSYGADSASRLINILESRELKNTVAKKIGLEKFEGSTSAQTLGESNLLEITVRSKSPYISYMEADAILKNYTDFSGDLVGGTELTVLERPKVQEKPEHPYENVKYAIIIAGIVFIVVCALLALLSTLRDTVHNSAEVESKIDTKLLATIMHEKKHRRGRKRAGGEKASILITDPVTSFQYAEDMRKLAVRIMNEMAENHQKVLLVSSAMENEGKSTVSVNIALAMAQINKRVVLVDMDFRKPSMYKILNMQNSKFEELGICIEEKSKGKSTDFPELVRSLTCRAPGTDLSLIMNRKAVPQAVEKHSEFIQSIIKELRNQADYIILDTAPVSLVSDAEELAMMVDTSIIVIRQHWIEAKEINDTIDALGGKEKMLGCVLNNAHKSSAGTVSTGYGYGYGGQYAK